jgi:hypothetical protein
MKEMQHTTFFIVPVLFRRRKLKKDRKYKDKRTNNALQNTTQKTKYWAIQGELR